MSTNKKGRPKQEQTKPLIFERFRSRVTRALSMSAKTAADLDRYIVWACSEVGADANEALTLVLDQALSQLFQRDKLFQEALKEREEGEGGKKVAATSAATPSSTMAPPTRPVPGSATAAAASPTAPAMSGAAAGAAKGTTSPQMAAPRPGTSQ
jgi:hypothetical protein